MIGVKAAQFLLLCQAIQQITAATTQNPPRRIAACPMIACVDECVKGVDSNGCTICNCQNTCQATKCSYGQKCIMKSVVCIKAPCNPQPTCVSDDDLATTQNPPAKIECPMIKCIAECFKGVDSNGCNICNCDNTCQVTKCPYGQKCVMTNVACFAAPCDQQPTCVPDDVTTVSPTTIRACRELMCAVDCKRIVGADGCPACDCSNTCAATLCPKGHQCVMATVVCKKAPCEKQAQCVPIDQPRTCPRPIECRQPCEADIGDDGCYSKCSCPPTCRDKQCQGDETCELVQVYCFRAPCFPVPTCRPKGSMTTVRPTTSKEPRTCPRPIVCKEPCVADFGSDGCLSKCACPPTCRDTKCNDNEVCELVQNRQCFRAPCFPDPTCVPKNRTCSQRPNVNHCSANGASWTRWTYNPNTKACESFRYYGCTPSPNTFNSARQCTNTCVQAPSCPPNYEKCQENCYFGARAPGACPECICPCWTVRCTANTECRLREGGCTKGQPCQPTAYCAPIPTQKCGPVCQRYCPHGNVKDQNGCDICQCNDAPTTSSDERLIKY